MKHTGPLAVGLVLESNLNWDSIQFIQIYKMANPLYAHTRRDATYIVTHYPSNISNHESELFKNIIIYRGSTVGNFLDKPSHLIHGRSHHWK